MACHDASEVPCRISSEPPCRVAPDISSPQTPQPSGPVPLFSAKFHEAYTLRNVLANIYKEVGQMSMFFSRDYIIISVMNKDQYATIELKIRTCDLQEYTYNLPEFEDNGDPFEGFPVGLDTQKMMTATKPIGRRDGVHIFMLEGESKIYVRTLFASNGSRPNPTSIIPELPMDGHDIYELPLYSRSDDDPNVTIFAKDFSLMCNSMNIHKCSVVEVLPYPHFIVFKGIAHDKSEIRIESFGKEAPPDQLGPAPAPIRIPIKTIKALAKVNAFAPNQSKIKVYHEAGKPLKITAQVGHYGTFTIVLKST